MSAIPFPAVIVLVASLVAAFTDVLRFKVYNILTFPLLAGGLAYRAWVGGMDGFWDSMAGVLLGFGVLLYPYLFGAFGAGDVKFVAAVGAWMGLKPMVPVLLIGCLATGVYAVVLLVKHNGYREAWQNLQVALFRILILGRQFGAEDNLERVQTVAQQAERRKRLIPFSAMITVGIVTSFIWSRLGR
jgi:prepilin peptidase CpaA